MKHPHLLGVFRSGGQKILLHRYLCEGFLLGVLRDTGVHGYSPHPPFLIAFALKGAKSLPEPDQHLLHQVVGFVLILGEHKADRVDGLLMPFDQSAKFLFVSVHKKPFAIKTELLGCLLQKYSIKFEMTIHLPQIHVLHCRSRQTSVNQ